MDAINDNLRRPVFWGILVLIVIVAGILIYQGNNKQSVLGNRITCVCVSTGEIFSLDRDQVTRIPVAHPKTQERSLLPCYRRDGQLYVDGMYRGVLESLREINHYVDEKTLAINQAQPL